MPARRPATPEPLGFAAALVPVVALVGLLGLPFFVFGDEAASERQRRGVGEVGGQNCRR
jgi:hypothetical protein